MNQLPPIPAEMIARVSLNQLPTAPNVYRFLKNYEIFEGENEAEIVSRIQRLLSHTEGISYSYYNYVFIISVQTKRGVKECRLNIFRNAGEFTKLRSKYSQGPPISGDKLQFVVEMDDLTRYFGELFIYIVMNYSAETIAPFSEHNLNYGLYCPDYTDEEDDDVENND